MVKGTIAMNIKGVVGYIVMMMTVVCLGTAFAGAQSPPLATIGIVLDGPAKPNVSDVLGQLEQETATLLKGDRRVRFAPEPLDGGWTVAGVRRALDILFKDQRIDLVITFGLLSSHEAAIRTSLPKPVIAPFIVDEKMQNIPLNDKGTSGVKNLNYLTSFQNFKRDVTYFLQMVEAEHLAVISDAAVMEAFRGLHNQAIELARSRNIVIDILRAGDSADAVLDEIKPGVDGVFITPLLRMPEKAVKRLIAGINARKLPSFSLLGRPHVEIGVLAGNMPSTDFQRLIRRIALHTQDILLGRQAGDLPVAFTMGEELTLNMATARAIGYAPSFELIMNADLIDEEDTTVWQTLTFEETLGAALAANLDLAAKEREIASGAAQIPLARSDLLPQLDVDIQGVRIDEDRAAASQGTMAETTLDGTLTLRQLIWAERPHANLAVQQHLQAGLEKELAQLRLDIILETAVAYVNVLRAKAIERLQKNNLDVTRSNLKLAEVRTRIGYSGLSDVYRWQSERATDRQAVLVAKNNRAIAEIALNQLLHRPLETPFQVQDLTPRDPIFITSDPRMLRMIDNPAGFARLRDFLVMRGFELSPDLKRVADAIQAQKRLFKSAVNRYISPTLALTGTAREIFDKSGAGKDNSAMAGIASQGGADDTQWSVALSVSYPLYSGGSKPAEVEQTAQGLKQLRLEQQALQERIEQNIRSILHQAFVSRASIQLSRMAAQSAQRNLDIITDAYSRGAASVIDLLDAQNAALAADVNAIAAVYDFLLDLFRAERAVGRFTFFDTGPERDAFFDRMDRFFQQKEAATP
jgi:outer membrane protein TolC